jgi:O-antigen ligase
VRARRGARELTALDWGAVLLGLAIPAIFLHVKYQPDIQIAAGSTQVGIELSDLAVLAVAVAALVAGLRLGFAPLAPARWLWIFGAAFLALVLAGTLYPLLGEHDYRFLVHFVTAAKFAEYGVLAPALPLLLRAERQLEVLLWSIAAWSAAATAWGLLQFAGLVNELEGRRPLQREPSFVGIHDFAALSGIALTIALAVLVLGRPSGAQRVLVAVSGAAGAFGLVLAAAAAGGIGILLAGLAALVVGYRRHAVTGARAALVVTLAVAPALGVAVMRNGSITQFAHYLGLGHETVNKNDVESYVHRSMLGYIGIRMFADHPVIGVGWQGSEELSNYRPYLADAHRRFPDAPAVSFPSPQHAWGVQNAYLQVLTDLGIVGLALLIALFAAGFTLAGRAALRAPPGTARLGLVGLLWLLIAAGVWNGLGLVAGIPLDAVTWLAFGLAATAAAWTARVRT